MAWFGSITQMPLAVRMPEMRFSNRITIKDYWRMFKEHGVRLPFAYFIENHLFDFVHNIDTHRWLPKDQEIFASSNRDSGVLYMASWRSVIRESTRRAFAHCPRVKIQLVDIGCGKGKVLCVWEKMFKGKGDLEMIGVDYNPQLIKICKANLEKIEAKHTRIYCEDITRFGSEIWEDGAIFFLYNPFDERIFRTFLTGLKNKNLTIIYVNPIYCDILLQFGFQIVQTKPSWHPTGSYSIFHRS